MVQKLGMAELFKKHSLWGSEISIVGIDGGAHKNADCDADDDCDVDSDGDDEGEDDSLNSEGLQNVTCFNEDTSIHECVQVSEDLKSMIENNIIDSALQQKMHQQQKIFYKQLPSSTIPMYQQVEKPDDSTKETKKLKSISTVKKFNPFVEVKTSSNKKILIRKTTALWLLQEGERISADRLFRVRLKQPYSNNVSTSQTDKPVILADSPSTNVILIHDNDDTNFSAQCIWLKIGEISLYSSDKRIILNKQWLWGTHLSAVQFLLKRQFPQISGLEDTTLVLREGILLLLKSIQVLHINGNHWIIISTIDSITAPHYDVTVSDSVNFTLTKNTEVVIAKLLKTPKNTIAVT